jgi:murein DD-endopeptidase MepM/ murein hydrolase activator NlpD
MIMLAPIPNGVLTRRDDPNTPEDERLHDGNSRDAGVVGNILNWPILSLFAGKVLTAGLYKGYGNTVRVEGYAKVSLNAVLRAKAPWPTQIQALWLGRDPTTEIYLPVRMLYGHLNQAWCSVGENVVRFQPLGGMGNTGQSRGVHLHAKLRLLELPEPECFVDPLPLFVYAAA